MMKRLYDFDLIIIGTGIGGSIAAQLAANQGKKVAVVDEASLGGEYANSGCIPTKVLLSVAHQYDNAKHADKFGLRSSTISYNYPSIRAWKDKVVRDTSIFADKDAYDLAGIKVITGHAGFTGAHQIVVGGRHYTSKYFLLATGSRLLWPSIDGLDRVSYMTHHDAVNLPKVPRSIAIVGGGATGCEFAELFAIFGSKVYIIEQKATVLPAEDKEVGETLATIFERDRSMTILTDSKVHKVRQTGAKKELFYKTRSGDQSIKVDDIMIATGKSPNVNLGLENVGVKYNDGGILVNSLCQTSQDYIYAIGDCTGVINYSHVSSMQAKVALHNIFNSHRIAIPNGPIPRCLSTNPEVACIGMTSRQARANHIQTKVAVSSVQSVPQSQINAQHEGSAKLIVDGKSDHLLGASVVAPHAVELIHELSIVMQSKMPVHQLQQTYHAFPSWSELIQVAAQKV